MLYLATHEEESLTVRALMRATGLGPASVMAELGRLTELGVLGRRPEGRTVHFDVSVRHPLWIALRTLVRAAAPVPDLLGAALADVDGIEGSFIFGSAAAGSDHEQSDVDLMIIGTPDERQLARRVLDASALLGREVDSILLTADAWAKKRQSGRVFWNEVARGPKAWLIRHGTPVRRRTATGRRKSAA